MIGLGDALRLRGAWLATSGVERDMVAWLIAQCTALPGVNRVPAQLGAAVALAGDPLRWPVLVRAEAELEATAGHALRVPCVRCGDVVLRFASGVDEGRCVGCLFDGLVALLHRDASRLMLSSGTVMGYSDLLGSYVVWSRGGHDGRPVDLRNRSLAETTAALQDL